MSLGSGASQLLGLRGDEKRAAMGDERVGEEPSERRAASARAEARATCSRVSPRAQTNEMSLSQFYCHPAFYCHPTFLMSF